MKQPVMIKDGMDDFIVPVDDNDYAVVRKAHVFHFLIMAGIIGCMFKKVFEESGQLFFFAEIRVAGNDRIRANAMGAEECIQGIEKACLRTVH